MKMSYVKTVQFTTWSLDYRAGKEKDLCDGHDWRETDGIQILIGSDLSKSLMTGQIYKLEYRLAAFESVFGWTLSRQLP